MNTAKDPIKHLDNQLEQSQFEFTNKLSLGFDIWKKGFAFLLVFMIVFIVISSLVPMIPYIGTILNSIVIGPVLTVGALLYCYKTDFSLNPEFGDFFDGFKFTSNIVIAQLLMTVVYILIAVPFIMDLTNYIDFNEFLELQDDPFAMSEMIQDVASSISIPMLIGTAVVYLVLATLFSFTLPLIAFYGLDAITALKYSFKYATKHFLLMFIFYIVITILAVLGIIGLGIGILLTITLMYTCTYAAFKQLTDLKGYMEDDETDNVLDSLVHFR